MRLFAGVSTLLIFAVCSPLSAMDADKCDCPKDDPATHGYQGWFRDWAVLAGDVVLRELSEGGHYFTSTRAADVAAVVTAACGAERSAHAER